MKDGRKERRIHNDQPAIECLENIKIMSQSWFSFREFYFVLWAKQKQQPSFRES